MKNTLLSRLFGLLAVACILPATLGTARAQGVFQSAYGGGSYDIGNSVEYTPVDGGAISVGFTNSFGVDNDVYVVKTNACGTLLWANSYDLGGHDAAYKVLPTSDGGYVVTGRTENTGNCCTRNDIFLLKLDANGNVDWANTYGGINDEVGLDVVQDPNDNYVIAGGTSSFGWIDPATGGYYGWIIKTDKKGQLIWSRVYGPERKGTFEGCTLAANGDILATGISEFAASSADIFTVRVDPGNGNLVWATHMLPGVASEGHRIRECANGDIIIAGWALSPSGNSAGYLLRTNGSGTYVADQTYEFPGGTISLNDVRELPSGDIAAVGYAADPAGGFGNGDLLLMETGPALGLNWSSIHGGWNFESGQGLAIAPGTAGPYDIFAIGPTMNWGSGVEDFYLLRVNNGGFSGCNDATPSITLDQWAQTIQYTKFPIPYAQVQCKAGATQTASGNQTWICHVCTVTRKSHDEDPGDISHNGGGRSADIKTGEDAGGMVTVQPNPVMSGRSFAINYRAPLHSPMTVTVADVAGRVVYNAKEDFPMIGGQKIIETKGWASGAYVVRVEINGTIETKRIVVIDK